MALIGGVIRNASTHASLVFANASITGNLSTLVSTDGYGVWNADWGYEGVNVTASASGYYSTSANFTSADVAYFPAYGAYGYWKVMELAPQPTEPSTCFTGDTEVLLADGGSRWISDIRPGDRLLGLNGRVNTVTGVHVPALGGRALYSFDGRAPFVTGEHPFLSESGWRCAEPERLEPARAGLDVAPLRPGDQLIVAKVVALVGAPGVETVFHARALTALERVSGDPSTLVYDLAVDGDHTYVANGYVVHNKTSSH